MSKNRRSAKTQSVNPLELVRQHMANGNFRDALKLARVASRQVPGPQSQLLLEQAMLARSQELIRNDLFPQAIELLVPLAKSSSDAEIRRALPGLLLRTGLLNLFPQFQNGATDEVRENLRAELFDLAVQHPEKAAPEDKELVLLIRESLKALEQSQDDAALELLRSVPRQSPGSQWRVFIRGLLGWYRQDAEAVEANWSRLEAQRLPARLATRLKTLAVAGKPGTGVSGLSRILERVVPGMRALTPLALLQSAMAREDWTGVLRSYEECRSALRTVDPAILARITNAVASRLIRAADTELLMRFRRHAEPLPFDPRWNRTIALCAEASDWAEDDPEVSWQSYLGDLDRLEHFSAADRTLAKSLVWARMAHWAAGAIDESKLPNSELTHDDETDATAERVRSYFESSLHANPKHEKNWEKLIAFEQSQKNEQGTNAAARRMLEHFPDNLSALRIVIDAEYYIGDSRCVLELARRAYRLRPLDDAQRQQLMATQRSCALQDMIDRKFDAARQQLADSAALEREQDWLVRSFRLGRTAILELLAGNKAESESAALAAQACFSEPTPALLHLTIESIRAKLPPARVAKFQLQWQTALKRACHSQTAGQMAQLMTSMIQWKVEYKSRDAQTDAVLDYIRRTTRVRFTSDDLHHVCEFLHTVDEKSLLEKYVEKGLKQCPDDPWFQFRVGELEINRGEYAANRRKAFNCFSRVIELCEGATDALSLDLVTGSRGHLAFLEQAGLDRPSRGSAAPFNPFGGRSPREILDALSGKGGGAMNEFLRDMADEMGIDVDFDAVPSGAGRGASSRR